jgi:hypothetical protein
VPQCRAQLRTARASVDEASHDRLRLAARIALKLVPDARAARFVEVRLDAFPEAPLRDAQPHGRLRGIRALAPSHLKPAHRT